MSEIPAPEAEPVPETWGELFRWAWHDPVRRRNAAKLIAALACLVMWAGTVLALAIW